MREVVVSHKCTQAVAEKLEKEEEEDLVAMEEKRVKSLMKGMSQAGEVGQEQYEC